MNKTDCVPGVRGGQRWGVGNRYITATTKAAVSPVLAPAMVTSEGASLVGDCGSFQPGQEHKTAEGREVTLSLPDPGESHLGPGSRGFRGPGGHRMDKCRKLQSVQSKCLLPR